MSTGSTTPTRSGAALPSEFSDPAIQQLMSAGSVRPLARERLERFVSLVEHLEDVTDTGAMAPLLA